MHIIPDLGCDLVTSASPGFSLLWWCHWLNRQAAAKVGLYCSWGCQRCGNAEMCHHLFFAFFHLSLLDVNAKRCQAQGAHRAFPCHSTWGDSSCQTILNFFSSSQLCSFQHKTLGWGVGRSYWKQGLHRISPDSVILTHMWLFVAFHWVSSHFILKWMNALTGRLGSDPPHSDHCTVTLNVACFEVASAAIRERTCPTLLLEVSWRGGRAPLRESNKTPFLPAKDTALQDCLLPAHLLPAAPFLDSPWSERDKAGHGMAFGLLMLTRKARSTRALFSSELWEWAIVAQSCCQNIDWVFWTTTKRHFGERRVLHRSRSKVDSSQSLNPCAIYQQNLHLVWISSPLVPTHLAPSTVSVELVGRAGQSLFPEVNSEWPHPTVSGRGEIPLGTKIRICKT